MLSLQGATTTTPGRCVLGLFHRMSQVAPCRQGTLVRQHIPGIRLSSELIQSEPYRMTRLIQTMQLFVHFELSTFKTFFAELEVLFGSHKPLILSAGRGQVKSNKLNDFDWCCFALLTNCQVDGWMSFSLRLQVKTGVNTVMGTPNPTWCHNKALSVCNVHLLLFGEAKGEKVRPLNVAIEMWRSKMRVLIGFLVHGMLQTLQKSQLSLLVASLWITRLSLASLVSGCTTALYTVEIADNGVEPRTSTTVTSGTVPMLTETGRNVSKPWRHDDADE